MNKYGRIPSQLEINNDGWTNDIQQRDIDSKTSFEDTLSNDRWLNINLDINELLLTLQQFGDLQEWTGQADGLRCFGNTNTNDISLCYNPNTKKVEELSCRLDLRQIDINFVKKVFILASKYDCLLIDNQCRLYEPTLEDLKIAIQASDAYRFVEDPKKFLDNLSARSLNINNSK